MSCANNVLPVYMWPSPGKIPEALCLPPVQVDTVHFSSEATETNGFSRLSSSLNRTAVIDYVLCNYVHRTQFLTRSPGCAIGQKPRALALRWAPVCSARVPRRRRCDFPTIPNPASVPRCGGADAHWA